MQSDDCALRCVALRRACGGRVQYCGVVIVRFLRSPARRPRRRGPQRPLCDLPIDHADDRCGAMRVAPGERSGAEDIASHAARARREAKRRGVAVHVLGRRVRFRCATCVHGSPARMRSSRHRRSPWQAICKPRPLWPAPRTRIPPSCVSVPVLLRSTAPSRFRPAACSLSAAWLRSSCCRLQSLCWSRRASCRSIAGCRGIACRRRGLRGVHPLRARRPRG